MLTRFLNRLARLLPDRKAGRTDFPYLLTGESDAVIPIRSSHQASVVAIAERPGEASVLVTDEFRHTDEFRAL